MRITIHVESNLKTKEVEAVVHKASQLGLRDTIVDMANDVVKGSPVLTGNNRRSISYGVSGLQHERGTEERQPGDTWTGPDESITTKDLSAAVYSTSGYGGKLEIDDIHPPYFRPALDRHIGELPGNIERHMP